MSPTSYTLTTMLWSVLIITLSIMLPTVSSATVTAKASFSQKGISGEVVFTKVHQYIEVKVNITGVGKDELNWEIRSLPVDSTVDFDCNADYLGSVYHGGALGWRYGYINDNSLRTYKDTGIMMDGRYSIIGRSLVLTSQKKKKRTVCATILPPAVQVATAHFNDDKNAVSGTVTFMEAEEGSEVQVVSDLYFTDGRAAEPWEWVVYNEPYNPNLMIGDQKFHQVNADLSSDLGPIEIGHSKTSARYMWTFTRGSLEALIGNSLVLFDRSNNKAAGATIMSTDPTVLKAKFTEGEMNVGTITFKQETRFHPTEVTLDMPEVKELYILSGTCKGGAIFNPTNFTGKKFIKDDQSHDRYAIGELSSRHEDFSQGRFIDHNLPLIGPYKIYGNNVKVVLSHGDVLCSKLKKDSVKLATAAAANSQPLDKVEGVESSSDLRQLQDAGQTSQIHNFKVTIKVNVDPETLSKYTVRWMEPTSVSSKEVVGHRIYYKEYGLEELIGFKDVPMGREYLVIIDEFRDLEFRWVEMLRDGSEGIGTPYFDTYYEGEFELELSITPTSHPDEVILDWEIPPASDEFLDVIPEYIVEWRSERGSHYSTQVKDKSKTVIPYLEPGSLYFFRVKQVRMGSRIESQLPWIPYNTDSRSRTYGAPFEDVSITEFRVNVQKISNQEVRVSWSKPPIQTSSYTVFYRDSNVNALNRVMQVKHISNGGAADVLIDKLDAAIEYEFQVMMMTEFGQIGTGWVKADGAAKPVSLLGGGGGSNSAGGGLIRVEGGSSSSGGGVVIQGGSSSSSGGGASSSGGGASSSGSSSSGGSVIIQGGSSSSSGGGASSGGGGASGGSVGGGSSGGETSGGGASGGGSSGGGASGGGSSGGGASGGLVIDRSGSSSGAGGSGYYGAGWEGYGTLTFISPSLILTYNSTMTNPTDVSIIISPTGDTLFDQINQYKIQYREQGTKGSRWSEAVSSDGYLLLRGLRPYTAYQVRVATGAAGTWSAWTETKEFKTAEAVPAVSVSGITLLAKRGSSAAIQVSWTRPDLTNGQLLGYRLMYTDEPSLPDDMNEWSIEFVTPEKTTHTLQNLEANTRYFVRLQAQNSVGFSPAGETFSIITRGGREVYLPFSRIYTTPLPSGSSDLRYIVERTLPTSPDSQAPGYCADTFSDKPAQPALRISKKSKVDVPTKDAFPDGFTRDFSVLVTFKASVDSEVPIFSIANGLTAEPVLALKISPNSVKLVYTDNNSRPGVANSPVWNNVNFGDGRWRRVSISIKGNSVTLFDECKEVDTLTLDRSDAGLDNNGVVFIGREFDSAATFEGDIMDLLIVGDPSAAYEMCQSYRPDCEDTRADKQQSPPTSSAGGGSPSTRIEYVPGEPGPPGPRGSPGPMGPKGNPGPAGRDGLPGMDGMPGPAGTVIVIPMAQGDDSKGPSGAAQRARAALMQQMASMRGAPGPQGMTGLPGMMGPPGPIGPKGESGNPGEQGMPGMRGNPGVPGPPGRRGKAGAGGERGPSGPPGQKGDAGYPGVFGMPGSKGDIGMPGDPGPIGQEGLRGAPGDQGPPGPDGPSGDPGPRGFIGPRGSPGPAGAPGAPGVEGPPGAKGEKGPYGPVGPPGAVGAPGSDGAPGPIGNIGPPGPPGTEGKPGLPGLPGTDGQAGLPGAKGEAGAKGDRGPEGPRGLTGPPGMQGNKGSSGDRGEPGQKGDQGLVGMDGPTGDPGAPGDRGQKGDGGPIGIDGDSGPKGDRGSPGEPGPSGPSGEKGPMGIPGFSGYPGPPGEKGSRGQQGRKGKPGEKGTSGPRGIMGERGSPGPMGPRGERGNPGPPGVSGIQGNQGAPGPTGEPGPQGAPGPEGQPGFQGPMGPPGNSGKDGPPGPMGERGAPGLPGDPGQPGPVGVVGQSGPPGPIGPSGERGDPGPSGPPGPPGFPGDPGRAGFPGPPGPSGPPGQGLGVPGAPGPIGSKGDPGPPGKDGERGPPGRPGKEGERGFRGPPGTPGSQGSQGATGQPGPRGHQGPIGPKGARGGDGPAGKDGPVGPQGPPGMPGPQGISGPPGEEGAQGPPGPSGAKGDRGAEGSQGPPGLRGPVGPRGAPGPQGPPGERGERGDQGPNGSKGSDGPPGAPGLPGVMGKQGMPGAPGPKGEAGDKGKTGSPGPIGPQGQIGQTGPRGEPGLPGPEGAVGQRGYPGRRGEAGQPGQPGEPGKPGAAGTQAGPPGPPGVAGPVGQPGDKGPPGEQGPKGPMGPIGAPGQAGPAGIMGPKGESGKDGKAGKDGPPGPPGLEGAVGESGPPGPRGPPGNDGNPGMVGPPGPAGEPGEQGPQGLQGIQGPPGGSGIAGPKGSQGPAGQPGPAGDPGPPGTPGKPGDTGPIGDAGLPGAKGETGEKGDKGDPGQLGPPGPPGILGEKGQQGPSGLPGREGQKGQPGPPGAPGMPGPAGPPGSSGSPGPVGSKGEAGRDGPPGPPGPPGIPGGDATFGSPIPEEFYARNVRNRRAIRTQMVADEPEQDIFNMPPSPTLGHVIEKLFQDIDDLKSELDDLRFPTGARESPARSCKDLYLSHPEFKDGWYWIDPNLGVINDAIQVWCNMTAEGETCVYPKKGHDMVLPRNWNRVSDKPSWFSTLKGGFQIGYAHESQMSFLRLIYTSASQKLTYFCSNTVAFRDSTTSDTDSSIGLLGHNEFEFVDKAMRKKYVLLDGCADRPTSGFSIFQIQTNKVHQLPIIDIQVSDFGKANQKFGFEMGPVCFGY